MGADPLKDLGGRVSMGTMPFVQVQRYCYPTNEVAIALNLHKWIGTHG